MLPTDMNIEDISDDSIENNYDEEVSPVDDSDETIDVPADNRRIVWQAKDYSIREFHSMRQDGDLDLQPDYQRKYVMSAELASRLIESILIDVPIPVLYLAEDSDGSLSVIDGQQRLTSFLTFLDGRFPNGKPFNLTGLKILTELNRKSFDQLDRASQTKIRTTTIHTIVIKKESNEDIKFEIFERLNTGSIKLNEDEIRNSVYRGSYIQLLAELEEDQDFHDLIEKDNFKKRMIYRGMILRFLAISERTYLNYKPSMKQFCNKELRDNRNMGEEKVEEYRSRFKHCVDLVKIVFGKHAFRRYDAGRDGNGGSWGTSRINMALFDIQMCGFANYSKSQILQNADAIREAMLDLMCSDSHKDFQESIIYKTSDRAEFTIRFRKWLDKLVEITGDPVCSQRCFSYAIKKQLFDANPTCAISGQRILHIDDSEVDHIKPFSSGGPTTIENAQLVLRYFNRAKGAKIDSVK